MVDVGAKDETHRVAVASGHIAMRRATLAIIAARGAKKGDVLGVARTAAIQGAKRTADLIPLAHPLGLTQLASISRSIVNLPQSSAPSRQKPAAVPASKWKR